MLRVTETIVRTDTGLHRSGNEDAAFARAPVFVLADGMGGAQSGEVASQIAVDAFSAGLPETGSPAERLSAVVKLANGEIYRRSASEAENAGMGTTLTAAYLDGDSVTIAHVGDSRAYLFRGGELRRLTQDHSLVEELLRGGKLTEQQALVHPQRSIITRALGPDPDVEVDTWTYPLRSGDVVLLCSDGLTDMLAEGEVQDLMAGAANLSVAADRMIEAANAAGGRDNITVVLFSVEDTPGAGTVEQPTEVFVPTEDVPPPTEVLVQSEADVPEEPITEAAAPAVVPPPSQQHARRAPLARVQGRGRGFVRQGRPGERHFGRTGKLVAATVAILAVVLIVGGGGYLATRQLYFLGTNDQGMVAVYRGLPYELPLGIPLYETFYVSGVPAQTVPADRRVTLLNHSIRGQSDATKLINDLELGKIAG